MSKEINHDKNTTKDTTTIINDEILLDQHNDKIVARTKESCGDDIKETNKEGDGDFVNIYSMSKCTTNEAQHEHNQASNLITTAANASRQKFSIHKDDQRRAGDRSHKEEIEQSRLPTMSIAPPEDDKAAYDITNGAASAGIHSFESISLQEKKNGMETTSIVENDDLIVKNNPPPLPPPPLPPDDTSTTIDYSILVGNGGTNNDNPASSSNDVDNSTADNSGNINNNNTNAPVMNLLEKYSAIDRGIDEARDNRSKAKKEIEEIQAQIQQLRNDRVEMQRTIETTKRQQQVLHDETQQELDLLSNLELEYSQQLLAKQQAKSKLEHLKRIMQDQRQAFLQESREFRTTCKRLCVRSTLSGIKYAPLLAYSTVFQQDCTNNNNSSNPISPPPFEDDKDIYNEENDTDIIDAIKLRDHRKDRYNAALEKLNETKLIHQQLEQKKNDRATRIEQLRSQLNRIQNETMEIQSNITSLQQETVATKQMAANLEKDVQDQRQKKNALVQQRTTTINSSSTHSAAAAAAAAAAIGSRKRPVICNPYGQSSKNSASSNNNVASRRIMPAQLTNKKLNPSSNLIEMPMTLDYNHNNQNQQHPHRAGRLRVSRKFGSALEIRTPPVPHPETTTTTTTADVVRRNTVRNNNNDNDDDSDNDDDDDELLSFVAFGGK